MKPDEISRNVGEIIIPPKMRNKISNELRQVSRSGTLLNTEWIKTSILEMELHKISKLLNELTVSKLITKNRPRQMIY